MTAGKIIRRAIMVTAGLIAVLLLYEMLYVGFIFTNKSKGYVHAGFSGLKAYFNEGRHLKWYWKDYLKFELEGTDGPYVLYEDRSHTPQLYRITAAGKLLRESMPASRQFVVEAANNDHDRFTVALRDTCASPPALYTMPDSVLVISDIEGNFNALYSLLVKNGLMDQAFQWRYGNNHLVLLGDFMDRGNNVVPVLWLIYHLEQQAAQNGGAVHFLLGNHEAMNLQGNLKYVQPKYLAAAQQIAGTPALDSAYARLWSVRSELGRWLRSRNAVIKIGSTIFVHGGFSPELVPLNLSLPEINTIIRTHIEEPLYSQPGRDTDANFLLGRTGPLWYRGLVIDYKDYYRKARPEEVDHILQAYDARRIVVGHTLVDHISPDGAVVRVDIKQPEDKFSGRASALLITGEDLYRVNDLGHHKRL